MEATPVADTEPVVKPTETKTPEKKGWDMKMIIIIIIVIVVALLLYNMYSGKTEVTGKEEETILHESPIISDE